MKKTFLGEKPLVTAMLHVPNIDEAIRNVGACLADGCDAICWQTCQLEYQFHNEESWRRVISVAGEKPVYVTYYRHHYNRGKSDEDLAQGLISLANSGATLCDVMGDLYDETPGELTMDTAAIDKQKKLIDQLHELGAEVLMSCHINKFLPAEKVLEIAYQHQMRGADITKIVTGAESIEEEIENLRITALLKKELKISSLFLSGGECLIHRRIGPMLGSCMWLCKQEYPEPNVRLQPLLKNTKAMIQNF